MTSNYDNVFDANKQNELLSVVLKISGKSKSLAEYCNEIKDSALSRDAEVRRNALNELAYVILNLSNDSLSDTEVAFLLEFFTARFSDSGHTADLLVAVVHYLIFVRELPNEIDIDALFHKIFDEAGVQAYIQSDREKLLEIFEFIIKKHFDVVKKAGAAQFYTVFANAAGGERDPRCLIQVFTIFVHVLERMDFGALMEDMFELVACYWPVEYQPKSTDKNPLSREALSAACDACLLANRGFSLYTYQIISEKFLDDDESATHEKKLEACKLLMNACQKFGTDSLEPFLNDYLAGFRMLCLNPKNHGTHPETTNIIGDTLKVLFDTIEAKHQNAEKIIKDMATTMLENSEPFVIQPEMGLSAKALCMLEKMSLANKLALDTILPRVFYWIYVLITGTTIKNQANKHEIIEETLALTPKWFELAKQTDQIDTNQTNILLSTVRKLEEFPKNQRLKMLCECETTLLKFDANLSNECYENIDETVNFIVEKSDDYDPNLRLPIFNFVSLYSTKRFDKCSQLISSLESTQKWSKLQFLLCASVASSPKNLSMGLKLYLQHLIDTDYLFDALESLLLLFDRIEGQENVKLYLEAVSEFLFGCIEQNLDNEKLKLFGKFLQDLGLRMDKESHQKLIESCTQKLLQASKSENYTSTVILLAPFCLQDQRSETHKQIVSDLNTVLAKNTQLLPYALAFYFAYFNQGGKDEIEVASAKWESKIAKCRSLMLTSNKLPSVELEEIFKNAPSSTLEQLLDFSSELTDPDKCRYTKTFMWAQRIVTQFIPFFVNYYKNLVDSKQSMASLIIPILRLAKRVTISMVSDLELLFPIIIEALHETNNDQDQILLLLNATNQLLQLSTNESLSRDKLGQIAYAAEKLLLSAQSSNKIIFSTLEVLELLANRTTSKTQILRLEQTLRAIRTAVQSKKRIIRQKAAFVRGSWEMITK